MNWDTWGAGLKYSDGPMAMSLSQSKCGEQEATMVRYPPGAGCRAWLPSPRSS